MFTKAHEDVVNVWLDGENVEVTRHVPRREATAGAASQAGSANILAPMPGRIVKVRRAQKRTDYQPVFFPADARFSFFLIAWQRQRCRFWYGRHTPKIYLLL